MDVARLSDGIRFDARQMEACGLPLRVASPPAALENTPEEERRRAAYGHLRHDQRFFPGDIPRPAVIPPAAADTRQEVAHGKRLPTFAASGQYHVPALRTDFVFLVLRLSRQRNVQAYGGFVRSMRTCRHDGEIRASHLMKRARQEFRPFAHRAACGFRQDDLAISPPLRGQHKRFRRHERRKRGNARCNCQASHLFTSPVQRKLKLPPTLRRKSERTE